MFPRLLVSKILADLTFYPGIVVLGPRQVGKTTLVKDLLNLDPKSTIYLDLEKSSDMLKLTDAERFLELNDRQNIVIDEVQRYPQIFTTLRAEIDRNKRPGRFILLGSSSDDLIRLSTDALAGRVAYHELHPLCIQEIPHDAYDPLWLTGGYPIALKTTLDGKPSLSQEWIANLVRSHIEREMATRALGIQSYQMELLLRLLSSINGQTINYSQLAKLNQVSIGTIKRYLNLLERAYLIRLLQPYFTNSKKRITKRPKMYIRDAGILHYLMGLESLEQIEGDYNKGFAWEGHVIQQIFTMIRPSIKKYFYRTNAGAEVDLVLLKGNKPFMAFEIKYSNSPRITKSSTNAFQDLQCTYNYVVTPTSDRYALRKSIEVISLKHIINIFREHDLLISNLSIKN